MPTAATAHIWLDERDVAWIDETNTKVIEVAQDMIAHGWSPVEIHFQHPHLSLAQIHAALGFYYDHRNGWMPRCSRAGAMWKSSARRPVNRHCASG